MAGAADRTRPVFHRATIRRIARELAAEPQSVPEVATDLPPSRSSSRSRIGASSRRRLLRVVTRSRSTKISSSTTSYDGAQYNAVKRFVGKLRPAERKVSCRF